MTMNDLSTIPPRPITDEELAELDTTGWTRVRDHVKFGDKEWYVDRFPVTVNDGHWTRNGERWGNITAQHRSLDAVQVIFQRIDPDGVVITQPIEVVPTAMELESIADLRESRRQFHAERHGL
jgi:hypothetical protein